MRLCSMNDGEIDREKKKGPKGVRLYRNTLLLFLKLEDRIPSKRVGKPNPLRSSLSAN